MEGHQASLQELTGSTATKDATNSQIANIPPEVISRYNFAIAQTQFTGRNSRMTTSKRNYTDNNTMVKANRQALISASDTKMELEKKYPSLADLNSISTAPTSDSMSMPTESDERRQVAALQWKVKKSQTAQFEEVQGEAAKLDEAETKISI